MSTRAPTPRGARNDAGCPETGTTTGRGKGSTEELKSLQPNTTVSSISEGIDLQQAVRRSVQEALEDYFPMQSSNLPTQSADVDVRAVNRCA